MILANFHNRSPYGKVFKIQNESVSFEDDTINCLCKVRKSIKDYAREIRVADECTKHDCPKNFISTFYLNNVS